MEAVIEFLRENWKFLVEIFAPILAMLILLIFKKRANITIPDSVMSDLLRALPKFIDDAEEAIGCGNGEKKLALVLKASVDYLAEMLGCSSKDILRLRGEQIIQDVENIMSSTKSHREKGDQ